MIDLSYFELTFLWSDILLWLVFILAGVAIYFTTKSNDLSSKWRLVFQQPIAVVSLIIFLFYSSIALLDSVHFQKPNQSNMISLLDIVLTHSINNDEKTYSSPLAYLSFNQSYLENGVRGFAPLEHAGKGIDSQDAHRGHLLDISLDFSIFIFILAFLYFIIKKSRARVISGLSPSTKAGLITIIILSLLLIWIAHITPHYHLLGTDKGGVDVFYKAIKSIRTSLIFGLVTTAISIPIAIFFGLLAGYFKGWVDDVIQFLYTTINAIPSILLIAALVVIVQVYMNQNSDLFDSNLVRSDVKLLLLCLVISLTSWTGLCRLIRAESLKLSELEFVQSAQIFGLSHLKILYRHLLPNIMHLVLITIALDFSALVLTESVLSYIGIGVDASTFSWGNMINSARLELAKTPIVWWSLAGTFVLMFVLVLAVNLLADRVREVFDPKSDNNNE